MKENIKQGPPTTSRLHSHGTFRQLAASLPKHVLRAMLPIAAAGLISVPAAQASLTYSGNLNPADPSTWTTSTTAYVGQSADGSITVDGGTTLLSYRSYLGYNAGVTGVVTVTGAGSAWTGTSNRFVGYNGNGVIYIYNGGSVSNNTGFVGYRATTASAVYVDGAGSRWTNTQIELGVNAGSNGLVRITNGGSVTSTGYLQVGEGSGATGSLVVDGAGSSLTNGQTINIGGYSGIGRLTITNGGNVSMTGGSSYNTNIGLSGSATGTAIVDGSGSRFTSNSLLNIGYGTTPTGRLSISNGGAFTASGVSINSLSRLTVDVGKGSSITVGGGSGTITNNGAIRLVAGASAAAGTYTPMSYGTMTGTGTVQALGGIWDATSRTVTVTSAAAGAAGSALTADLATTQRFLFTDGSTGKSVGAGFQAATSPTSLTLTASAISGSELTSLQSLVGTGQAVLSAWDFTTEGYTAGNSVYLSLFAGSGQNLSNLNIWHYDGSAWSKYDAADLAYDNNFASFTATGLSGYAVSGTAPVPIPAAAWLLGSGLLSLVGIRKKKSA